MKIHLGGSRTVLKDHVNVDKYLAIRGEVVQDDALDYMRTVPEGAVESIITKHMIEHLPKVRADQLVRHCFRALQLGGTLHIECPDLLEGISHYLEDPAFITSLFGIQRHGGDYHLWGYTKVTLRELLEKWGFEIIHEGPGSNYQRQNQECLKIIGRKPCEI